MFNPSRPKYIFCWWCNRQLWGKRKHVSVRSTVTANENADAVSVHGNCAESMVREGGWEILTEIESNVA